MKRRGSWKGFGVAVMLSCAFVFTLLVVLGRSASQRHGRSGPQTAEEEAAINNALAALRTIPRFDQEEEPKPETRPEAEYRLLWPKGTTRGASSATEPKWYEGGTLHRATGAEWRHASAANRLATAADWYAAMFKREYGIPVSGLAKLRTGAELLVEGVDATAGEGGFTDSMNAGEMAAAIWVLAQAAREK